MAIFCVDASVIVASLVRYEPGYDASAAFLAAWINQPDGLVAPELTKVEVVAALARTTGDSQLALRTLRHLKTFIGLEFIRFGSADIEQVAQTAARLRLRTGDAFYVQLAKVRRIPVVTLDREIITIAHRSGVFRAILPSEALS